VIGVLGPDRGSAVRLAMKKLNDYFDYLMVTDAAEILGGSQSTFRKKTIKSKASCPFLTRQLLLLI
jgi:hypothetical protein